MSDAAAWFEEYVRTRDIELRNRLVEHYTPLVRYVASRFAHRGESMDDLLQVGFVGLLGALDRYDPQRGVEFTTFATPTIVGEIKRYFRDRTSRFHVSRSLQELQQAVARLTDEHAAAGRSVTVAQLAAALGVEEEDVLEAQELGQAVHVLSLESSHETEEEGRPSLLDMLGRPDLQLEGLENRLALEQPMAQLPKRDQLVLFLRFFEGRTQQDISRILHISQMHVSRLLTRALETLRQRFEDEMGKASEPPRKRRRSSKAADP